MSSDSHNIESNLISCCYIDGATVDMALAAGVSGSAFYSPGLSAHWQFLCELRLSGKSTEADSVYTEAVTAGRLEALGGIEGIVAVSATVSTTAHAAGYIRSVLDAHAKRQALLILQRQTEAIKSGAADLAGIRESAQALAEVCAGHQSVHRVLPAIVDEAIKDAEEQISGIAPTRTLIHTGLPKFDRYATPMEAHEYVVVGARTSHGKSSFLNQVIGTNLANGRRVAAFTLETSDKSVLKQIVGQRAGVNVRDLAGEVREKQEEYIAKLKYARTTKNLMIFDQDLTLTAIEARCRLLSATFKPELVVIDYLGLIGVDGTSQYERTTVISKAMIPLRKALGCTLMLGAQLGRGSEKEEREPARTDFRDSGSIEEDASRLIVLWRLPGQPLDLSYFETTIMQLKMRDGPLARVDMKFHAPTTRFLETA